MQTELEKLQQIQQILGVSPKVEHNVRQELAETMKEFNDGITQDHSELFDLAGVEDMNLIKLEKIQDLNQFLFTKFVDNHIGFPNYYDTQDFLELLEDFDRSYKKLRQKINMLKRLLGE